ncbi:MAG: hypothetical protein CMI54_04230 [Parcubacteria group bacterium]|nr:hypothetical protein [Parcubacteria group bacterium]|tara:strand:+ start:1994 stop:2179 length:186 start_codon:yes stop_codon:yes gene_type:complete
MEFQHSFATQEIKDNATPVLDDKGDPVADERIVVSKDAYAIGFSIQNLINELEIIRTRGLI